MSLRRVLSVVSSPATTNAADSPVAGSGTINSWAASSASAYGGGALWVAAGGGLVACVNPVTGTVRAQETVTSQQGQSVIALAADGPARQIAAVLGTAGVVAISPPCSCWS